MPKAKPINLALQGGGSHGAFTWGVLHRILDDGRLEIDSITGASAGAVNAVVLADGYAADGRTGAIEALEALWSRVGRDGLFSPFQRSLVSRMTGAWHLDDSPGFLWLDMLGRIFAPGELNPGGYNPLAPILDDLVDFERVRHAGRVKLFLCATNVRSGRIRVFDTAEVCRDAVLASACLPFLFPPVEHEGEAYWDGGYMGNPALYPLAYRSRVPDVLIVQINPLDRDEVPNTARDIINRVNEITFNATLMREMRAVRFVNRLLDGGVLEEDQGYKRTFVHMIDGGAPMAEHTASSKLNTEPAFLRRLHDQGFERAGVWLDRHFDAVGVRNSVDVADVFL
jgi:NTE family protein